MSEYEHVKGKMVLLDVPKNIPFVDQVKFIQKLDYDIEFDIEYGEICGSGEIVFLDGDWFAIIERVVIDPYDDIATVKKIGDYEYEYECRWYNGGACLEEIMAHGMRELKENIHG